MAVELAAAYVTIIPSLKGASKTIQNELSGVDTSKVGKSLGSRLSGGVSAGLGAAGKAFGKLAKVGTGAIAALGAGVAGVAAQGGISRALKLEQANSMLKGLGLTGEEIASAMDSANESVTGTAFGLDSAAQAAALLSTSGVQLGDDMTRSLKAIAGTATMAGSSMEDITDIFQVVAAQGKLGGDELNRLSSRGVNAVSALSKHLGKSQEEVRALVSAGKVDFQTFSDAMYEAFGDAAQGANETFSGAMSNVRAALSRLGAKFAAPGLEALRRVFVAFIPAVNAVSAALDPVAAAFKRFADAASLRLSKSIEAFTFALRNTGDPLTALQRGLEALVRGTGLEGAVSAVTGFASSLSQAAADGAGPLDLLKLAFERLRDGAVSTLDGLQAAVAGKLASLPAPVQAVVGALEGGAGRAAGAVGAFALAFAKLSGPLAALNSGIGTVARVALPALKDKLAIFGATVGQAGGGIGGLGRVLAGLAGPVGIAVGIISALAAGFAYLMATDEGFRETVGGLASQIGASLVPVFETLAATVAMVAAQVMPAVNAAIDAMLPVMAQLFTTILQVVAALMPIIAAVLQVVIPIIGQVIAEVVQLASAIIVAVMPVISAILGVIQAVLPAILGIVTTVMGAIQGVVEAVWPVVQSVIETAMGVISAVIGFVMAVISGDWETVWNTISGVVETVWGAIQGVVGGAIDAVLGVVTGIGSAIKNTWDRLWSSVGSIVSNAWNNVKSAVGNGISNMMSAIREVPGKVKDAFSNAGRWLLDAGRNIITGLIDGITGMLGELGKQLGNIGQFIIDHKGPPSYDRVMLVENGRLIMGGLISGITGMLPELEGALALVSDSMAVDAALGVDSGGLSGAVAEAVSRKPDAAPAQHVPSPGAQAAEARRDGRDGRVAEMVTDWLDSNLGPIIWEFTPVMGERDFGRRARKAVTA